MRAGATARSRSRSYIRRWSQPRGNGPSSSRRRAGAGSICVTIGGTTSMVFAISFIAMFTLGGISGVMHSVAPSDLQQSDTYFTYERSYGEFSRSFTMPDGVDLATVNADLKDGVLTLFIKKMPEAQPKKIAIQSAAKKS